MAQEKLSMKKNDVEKSISDYVKRNFYKLDVKGRERPESISSVLATIQDSEYFGAGNYNVLLDIYGIDACKDGLVNLNAHYQSLCSVNVISDSEGCPMPKINESLILSKQRF